MTSTAIMPKTLFALLLPLFSGLAFAQAAPPSAPAAPPAAAGAPAAAAPAAAGPLSELAWLRGCWQGKVNQREFTEQWTAPAAGMMLGLGHTVLGGKTASHEFMRIEAQPDGKIVYVANPLGRAEDRFVYTGTTKDQDTDLFTFANAQNAFPAKIIYRRTAGGMMFAQLEGKVDGNDRQVIYPFRPVDCLSGKTL